eukprot:6387685-Karenia_brevis.AAC.1
MMGDSADETMMLTKFLDEEAFDLAQLDARLKEYVERHEALFVKGMCLHTGLTQHMIKTLSCKSSLLQCNS